MSVINNELTCLALTDWLRAAQLGQRARLRSASCDVEGAQSDATQLDVELS